MSSARSWSRSPAQAVLPGSRPSFRFIRLHSIMYCGRGSLCRPCGGSFESGCPGPANDISLSVMVGHCSRSDNSFNISPAADLDRDWQSARAAACPGLAQPGHRLSRTRPDDSSTSVDAALDTTGLIPCHVEVAAIPLRPVKFMHKNLKAGPVLLHRVFQVRAAIRVRLGVHEFGCGPARNVHCWVQSAAALRYIFNL